MTSVLINGSINISTIIFIPKHNATHSAIDNAIDISTVKCDSSTEKVENNEDMERLTKKVYIAKSNQFYVD